MNIYIALIGQLLNSEKWAKCFFIGLATIIFSGGKLYAQEKEFRKTSITTGVGIGFNMGKREGGIGLIYSIGWQKSFGKKSKLRVNPYMITGGFWPFGISDTRDQFYRITTLGVNVHYDLIKYKAFSVVTTVGAFGDYSRGLLGTGGWPEANNNQSEYFHSIYCGNNMSLGLRINPERSRIAVELRPVNIHLGTNHFILGYLMLGVNIKLTK